MSWKDAANTRTKIWVDPSLGGWTGMKRCTDLFGGGTMNKYKCPACKKIVKRSSEHSRHRSYCDAKGKAVWLIKVTKVKQ